MTFHPFARNSYPLGRAIALERLLIAQAHFNGMCHDHLQGNDTQAATLADRAAFLCRTRAVTLLRDAVNPLIAKRTKDRTHQIDGKTADAVLMLRGWRKRRPGVMGGG